MHQKGGKQKKQQSKYILWIKQQQLESIRTCESNVGWGTGDLKLVQPAAGFGKQKRQPSESNKLDSHGGPLFNLNLKITTLS